MKAALRYGFTSFLRGMPRGISALFARLWLLTMLWLAYQRRVRQLQRKSRELRDMIETIPAMAWTARPDGSNPFVNRRWAEFTGLSAARLSCFGLDGRSPSRRSPGICG